MEYNDKILNYISRNENTTQREITKYFSVSLGYTNSVLHNLVEKGFLKIEQVGWRKFRYTLTPQGAKRNSELIYDYITNAIRNVLSLEKEVKNILEHYGLKDYAIYLDGEKDDIYHIIKKVIDYNNMLSKVIWLRTMEELEGACKKTLVISWNNKNTNKELCKSLGIEYINLLDAVNYF